MCDVIKIPLNPSIFFRGFHSHFSSHPSFLDVFFDVTLDTFGFLDKGRHKDRERGGGDIDKVILIHKEKG